MQWQVALNNDSFDRAGITKDCQDAVCEYIWNSFEAGASKVTVSMMGSPLQEAMSLVVADNGMGIAFDNLDKTFGTFLSSLKNNATLRLKSQSNKGKGRFSYLSFSHSAEWHTVYRADSKLKQYTISTNSASRSQFDTTEPVDVIDETETGTTVTFSLEDSNTADLLSFGAMKQKLLEEFAWYLFLNKDKGYVLEYTGISLDISEYIRTDLSRNCLCKIGSHDFSIDVVVWNSNVSNSSKIYYRTENGEIAATQNTSFNKNTVKFYHAVFVSSKYVLQIVEQVVNLTSEQRKNFADVLKRSQLQYIVEAISIIEKRISVIEALKKIVFDYTEFANERDHVQKLIEQHFWLFGEQYHMLTADKNMRVALSEFEKITAQEPLNDVHAIPDKEALQRMDIFLYSQQVLNNNESEMLIVELKAPHVKLSIDVFNQIVRYANTIRKEPRFTGSSRLWKFYAVCAEVEDDVKVKYKNFEHHGKKGLVDIIENFELYALSWDDIFQAFEARHSFLLGKLKLDYSQVEAELGVAGKPPASKADVNALTQKLVAINA